MCGINWTDFATGSIILLAVALDSTLGERHTLVSSVSVMKTTF